MKRILLIAAIALLAVACNKDQKVVKKLDGSWNATKWTAEIGGVTFDLLVDDSYAKYTFTECKIKDGDFCPMSYDIYTTGFFVTVDDDGSGLYTVTNDGGTLQTKDDLSSTTINSLTIEEYTNKTLKLKSVEEITFEGETITINYSTSLEKQ